MRKTATLIAFILAAMTALFLAPQAANAAPTGDGTALDARKAAGADGVTAFSPTSSWYSGTVNAGGTQHWQWNNAPADAYKVGFSPSGASTTASCQFQVTRTWYVQHLNGGTAEREFHFNIKNIGTLNCGTTILLNQLGAFTNWSTGGVNPGATQTWQWNNANPLNSAHLVGLIPSGATSTTACQFEVTRTWYEQQPGGEREFHFNVKNVGTIACSASIRLANATTTTSWSTGALAPGASGTWHWNNANPLTAVYLPGVSPQGASGLQSCDLEITAEWYIQRLNSGTAEREFYFTVKNVGSLACTGDILLATA